MEYNTKLYLLVSYIGFLAPFLLRGLTWAMLYVWTKNYPQVVGTCSGHHGQLISQNCVPTKIRAEPPPPPPPLKVLKCNIYCFLKLLFSILSCKSGIIFAAFMIELDPYYFLLYILYNLLHTFISN